MRHGMKGIGQIPIPMGGVGGIGKFRVVSRMENSEIPSLFRVSSRIDNSGIPFTINLDVVLVVQNSLINNRLRWHRQVARGACGWQALPGMPAIRVEAKEENVGKNIIVWFDGLDICSGREPVPWNARWA
jgi:hypothetical protein